jgi:hypothetical protein
MPCCPPPALSDPCAAGERLGHLTRRVETADTTRAADGHRCGTGGRRETSSALRLYHRWRAESGSAVDLETSGRWQIARVQRDAEAPIVIGDRITNQYSNTPSPLPWHG